MTKILEKKRNNNLKTKIINLLMVNGEKKTGEKILLKFAKKLQKLSDKNLKNLIQLAIINTTPTFKSNEQIVKKGKRKAIKNTLMFITTDSLRVTASLKLIKKVVIANKNKSSLSFYESLVNEIIASSSLKGQSVQKKNDLQEQVTINKRYLSKFRW